MDPLFPLLFILGFDNLSSMFTIVQIQRSVVSVEFPNLGIANLPSMYADNTNVIIRAELGYVMAMKKLLDTFWSHFWSFLRLGEDEGNIYSKGPATLGFLAPPHGHGRKM